MGFPGRIERTFEIKDPQERVWQALTTVEGLDAWFGQPGCDHTAGHRQAPGSAGRGGLVVAEPADER